MTEDEARSYLEIIKDELNVKHVEVAKGLPAGFKRVRKPNFKELGKKFGKDIPKVVALIKSSMDFPFEYDGILIDWSFATEEIVQDGVKDSSLKWITDNGTIVGLDT